jgi:transcription antitermination factor NusG
VRLDEAGKRIRTRGPGAVVRRPLFRGYLFAALYEGQSEMALATAAGVGGILHHRLPDGTRGPAWLVRDAVIEAIRTEVDSGRWDQVDLEPGNEVRISDEAGLWAGMIAKLVAVDEKMARVLIQFLGREDVPTSVPTHLLSVVIS